MDSAHNLSGEEGTAVALLPFQLLLFFCHCSVESILTYGFLARYASCTAADKKH